MKEKKKKREGRREGEREKEACEIPAAGWTTLPDVEKPPICS